MNKQLALNVFDLFWINCQANNIMTVLTTLDDSYVMIGAGNHYTYEMNGRSGWFKSPTVIYDDELERNLYKVGRKKYIFESEDIIQELILRVKEERLISVEIDLFNWNPLSINYHRNHVTHMTMCIGFDEEKQELYFDDAAKGQKKLVKKYNEFLEAVVFHDGYPEAIETVVPQSLEKYHYDYETIREQAARLVNNINLLRYQSYFSTYEQPQDINIVINDVTKIYNRQLATKVMLEKIYVDGHITEAKYQCLCEKIEFLIRQWDLIKNKMMKMTRSARKHDFSMLDERADEAFLVEQAFWESIAEGYLLQVPHTVTYDEECRLRIVPFVTISGDAVHTIQKQHSVIGLEKVEVLLDEASDYFTIIKLYYSNVAGSLRVEKNLPAFVIQSVSEGFTEANYVKSVSYDGSIITLKTECPFADISGLWHFTLETAQGVEVIDDNGNKCPCIKAKGLGIYELSSPYINVLEYSEPVCCDDITSAPYPVNVEYRTMAFANYECDLATLFAETMPEKTSVYCRVRFTSDQAIKMRFWLGHQHVAKLWINGSEIGSVVQKESSPHNGFYYSDFAVKCGENEVLILYDIRETARGIVMRLEDITNGSGIRERKDCYSYSFPRFMSHGVKQRGL